MKEQDFLDTNQYSRQGIKLYEEVFGSMFVSTGGLSTTKRFCEKFLDLKPGQRVLDLGCGIGGSAFYMARNFEVGVLGVDLSRNMIEIAQENWENMDSILKQRVKFRIDNAVTMEYPNEHYDVVYSRDAFLHISDKESLFRKLYETLKPGGKLFITDYCLGGNLNHSEEFLGYIKQRGYELVTVEEYGKTLEKANFRPCQATDITEYFIDVLKREMEEFKVKKEEISSQFEGQGFENITRGWSSKIDRCSAGEQAWGMFLAVKSSV